MSKGVCFSRGTVAYVLLCAALSCLVQVSLDGSFNVQAVHWDRFGLLGVLASLQQFLILTTGGIGLFLLVVWLYDSPPKPGPGKSQRRSDTGS
jgi:hypothetical protein